MAVLTDLPPELIEQIFHDLGSIDDVHCLGRSCRKMCRIIQRQNLYVLIMRSIISQGSQHRYDHQLCQMLQLHRDVAAKIRNQSTLLFVDRGAPRRWKEDATTEWKERLKAIFAPPMDAGHGNGAILTDNEVYEILARYQGLRFLENTWLCRQVISKGFITADEHDNVDQLLGAFQSLLDHLDTIQSTRSQSHQSSTTNSRTTKSFGPDQRARFHSAITHNWLLNEIRWLFTQFGPVGHVIPVELLEECKDNINSHDNKPLLDNLDQYATFRFLYHHLLPSCSSVLTDRSMSKLPLTFTNDSSLQDVCRARILQTFLAASQTYLQPPDIIDLYVRHTISRMRPYPICPIPLATDIYQIPSQAMPIYQATRTLLATTRSGDYREMDSTCKFHLRLMIRASFHQTHYIGSPAIVDPAEGQLFDFRDHANDFYRDRAITAFEMYEAKGQGLKDIRDVFGEKWDEVLWKVWWWAGSGEKARAQLERWRQ